MIAIQILGVVYVDSLNRKRRILPVDPHCSATRPTLLRFVPDYANLENFGCWFLTNEACLIRARGDVKAVYWFPFRKRPLIPATARPSQRPLRSRKRATTCKCRVKDGFPDMSAHVLPQESRSQSRLRGVAHSQKPCWQISLSVSVNADRYRLFHALTVPEYMEAWICLPGDKSHSHVTVAHTPGSYRIDSCGAGLETTIVGNYLFRRRSKMLFTWRKSSSEDAPVSLVMVRLCGDFARTSLCLSHSDLTSRTEYLWHQEFWEKSLNRLCSLF
jgi:uncharacterized protein YndB with AHSA1/START domain